MPSPGDVVGDKYRLLEPIAEGGMASVWKAEQLTLQTQVALKLLAFEGDWLDGGRERFLEEARIAAGVKHRNVVQTLDFGATDDGVPFIVMELLDGDSLAERIEAEAPMKPEVVLEIADQILAALAAAHAVGIVHRDLKPDNVLFSRDTDGSFPKLIDFGISKSVESAERRGATRPGVVLGTPEFMSPEQAAGLEQVDHRTDLYAVGVVLYEMLSGTLPFESEHVSRVLIKVIAGGAPTLAERGLAVPRALSDAVARAMAVEPNDRFEDAAQMRAALDAVARGLRKPAAEPRRREVRIPDLDPEPAAPADPAGRGRWMMLGLAALLLLGIPAAFGLRAAWLPDDPSTDEPADVVALRDADDHTIYVRLRDFPEGGTLSLDGEAFPPEAIEAMRRGEVLEVPVPRRRGRPFHLQIARHGYEDWRMRRWTVRDFEARVIMTPALD